MGELKKLKKEGKRRTMEDRGCVRLGWASHRVTVVFDFLFPSFFFELDPNLGLN